MKICRFQKQSSAAYGVLEDDRIKVLSQAPFAGLEYTGEELALAEVQLLAPVVPPNILAIGLNYRAHAQETNTPLPERPLVFIKATSSVVAPGQPIRLPRGLADHVDYEAELAVVIGKTARHVGEEEALDYVLGYTCANDVSQRLCQKTLDGQWARAKSFDTFCPLGPWIETEIADPQALRICSRLNGKVMQNSNTKDMIFGIRHLVSYLSAAMTLLPGTVIVTGTPEGVGVGRNPEVYLQVGDTIEIEIEGLGCLSNPVIAD